MIPRIAIATGLFLTALATAGQAQTSSDAEAVRQTLLAYVQSLYDGHVDTLKASVHKDARKIGFVRSEGEMYYRRVDTDRGDMEEYARAIGRGGGQPGDRTQEIVVLDLQDQTAVAKVTVAWGMEYALLAKDEERWVIVGILWQQSTQN